MTAQEYRENIRQESEIAASINMTNPAEEFVKTVTSILSEAEEFDDYIECYYEGTTRRNANMCIDGYSISETDGSCCIFISNYMNNINSDALYAEDINVLTRKMRFFVEEAINNFLYKSIEESTDAYEFAKYLSESKDSITKIRFFVLTDAFNRQRTRNVREDKIDNIIVETHVWDIERIFEIISSKTQKESIEIDLKDFGCKGIPCVKAVEYHDVTADIDVLQKIEMDNNGASEEHEDFDEATDYAETNLAEKPANIISYSSYLAVVPGDFLNTIYMEYGARLLEGNVRSFLSAKGKVNKGIQNTIKNYPEMFFAYNNGIAATATSIETEKGSEGLVITKINDLQIVNGGQTTASITNTILTLSKDEEVDISKLFVPMKISVLEHEESERIIPKIAEYSNSQNKVDASDFFSNHPFHIAMEGISRRLLAPAINGNQYRQHWYYERTRGQYNQDKMKYGRSITKQKEFERKYPEKQVIKMVDLTKYMEIYLGNPHVVSKGKQEIVRVFAQDMKDKWEKSSESFNELYYKKVVCLAILFKKTDDIVRNSSWYKEKHSYKANVVTYAISLLFDIIKRGYSEKELNFNAIWDAQNISPVLEKQMGSLCNEAYAFITRDDRGQENVTQWCKQALCWTRAKEQNWRCVDNFDSVLISKAEMRDEIQDAIDTQRLNQEIDIIEDIVARGPEYWNKVKEWGKTRGMISEVEESILRRIISNNIPSLRQAGAIMRMRNRLIANGMPIMF